MPQYPRLVIESVFDTIWETWLNRDGERAAMKAVEVCLNSDHKKEDLLKACEIYRLEHINDDPDFTYKLSNFIMQDHWLDVLQEGSLDKLIREKETAERLMHAWNKACRPHWCKCQPKARLPLAIKALKNKDFRDKWEQALKIAAKIFRYPFRENDHRRKITLSFAWFTSTIYDKHTVLRLVEGEYGEASQEVVVPKEKPVVPVDKTARSEASEMMKQFMEAQFPGAKQRIQHKNRPRKTLSDYGNTKQDAEKIIKSMGLNLPPSKGDDEFTLS